MIILTRITHHKIFYAYRSLLDKYCENKMCKYKYRHFKNDTLLWDSVFPFGYKGLSTSDSLTIWCTATVTSDHILKTILPGVHHIIDDAYKYWL